MCTVPTTIHIPQLCLGMQKEEEVACFQMALGMSRVAKCTMNKQAMHPTSCSPHQPFKKNAVYARHYWTTTYQCVNEEENVIIHPYWIKRYALFLTLFYVSAISNQTYDHTKKTTINSELSLLNDFETAACGPLINHLTAMFHQFTLQKTNEYKNTHLFAVYKISTQQSIQRKST